MLRFKAHTKLWNAKKKIYNNVAKIGFQPIRRLCRSPIINHTYENKFCDDFEQQKIMSMKRQLEYYYQRNQNIEMNKYVEQNVCWHEVTSP